MANRIECLFFYRLARRLLLEQGTVLAFDLREHLIHRIRLGGRWRRRGSRSGGGRWRRDWRRLDFLFGAAGNP